jgi:hypothetical protein
MNWDDYEKCVYDYACHLCKMNNKDPLYYYEEFNRDFELDCSVKIYAWMEYELEAQRAVSYFIGEPE